MLMRDRMVGLVLSSSVLVAAPVVAQEATVPDGGKIVSMGQPSLLKPYGGLSLGGYFEDQASALTAFLSAGLRKDLLSPIAAVAAVQIEGYGGLRGGDADGGVRALFSIPFLWLSGGVISGPWRAGHP